MELTAIEQKLPDFFVSLLKGQYGEEVFGRILKGYAARRKVTLRVNRLKANKESVAAALSSAGISYRKVPWFSDAFIVEEEREDAVRRLSVYEEGKIYLQSLSSMIPPLIVDPKEKENILDMAAAPGGKTTELASLSGNAALITACEMNKIRARRLEYNLKKQGATRASVMIADGRRLDPYLSFHKILLDAPCSGSGTVFVDEGGSARLFSEKMLKECVKAQEELLKKAIELVKIGGTVVYSTCSVLYEENEAILEKALAAGNAEIVPIERERFEGVPLLPVRVEGTLSVCPSELYEGFFVSQIRKIKK